MESILNSTKKKLGIAADYTHFDDGDLIDHINSVFMELTLLGVGPTEGFIIEDENAVWEDFIPNPLHLQAVKTYVFLNVKLIFDPPQSSSVLTAYQEQIKSLEWKLNVIAESIQSTQEEVTT